MHNLTSQDMKRLSRFISDLYRPYSQREFAIDLVRNLSTLLPAELYTYNEFSASRKLVSGYAIWPMDFPLPADAPDIVGRYQFQHPTVNHYLSTGSSQPTRISDFVSYRQFRRTDLYNEFYRPMRIPYGIGFGVALHADGLIGIGMHRSGKDYSDRERDLLALVSPHILQAYSNTQAAVRLTRNLTSLYDAIESFDVAVVCVRNHSTIQWASPAAHRLIQKFKLTRRRTVDRLVRPVADWLKRQTAPFGSPSIQPTIAQPLVLKRDGNNLTIRHLSDGAQELLLLELPKQPDSLSLEHLGLSKRETEVLVCLSQGRTNLEIGTILGISPRTAQKHLDRIYVKLCVETRHAAARLALESVHPT